MNDWKVNIFYFEWSFSSAAFTIHLNNGIRRQDTLKKVKKTESEKHNLDCFLSLKSSSSESKSRFIKKGDYEISSMKRISHIVGGFLPF